MKEKDYLVYVDWIVPEQCNEEFFRHFEMDAKSLALDQKRAGVRMSLNESLRMFK